MSLRSVLDATDMVACLISMTIVVRQALWLHLSGFAKEVQTTVEDLPFEGMKLCAEKTVASLHTLKDSRVTLLIPQDLYSCLQKKVLSSATTEVPLITIHISVLVTKILQAAEEEA